MCLRDCPPDDNIPHMGNIESNSYDIFPIGIGVYYKPDSFTEQEQQTFSRYEQETLINLEQLKTVDTYVLNNIRLKNVKSFIDACLSKYMDEFMNSPTECRITQSWLNFYKKGAAHHRHAHANSYLSGVLYIEAGEGDQLHFNNPHSFTIMPPLVDYNMYNSNFWFVPVKSLELLIFPSWVDHYVEKTTTDRRVSLSFNSFPVGALGTERSINSLYIK